MRNVGNGRGIDCNNSGLHLAADNLKDCGNSLRRVSEIICWMQMNCMTRGPIIFNHIDIISKFKKKVVTFTVKTSPLSENNL